MKNCLNIQSQHRAAGHAPKRSSALPKKRIWPTVAVGGAGKHAPPAACLFGHGAEAFACPWSGTGAVESGACLVDHVGAVLPCAGEVRQ